MRSHCALLLRDSFLPSASCGSLDGRANESYSFAEIAPSEGLSAGVVELEYTAALGATALAWDCGFESRRPHSIPPRGLRQHSRSACRGRQADSRPRKAGRPRPAGVVCLGPVEKDDPTLQARP